MNMLRNAGYGLALGMVLLTWGCAGDSRATWLDDLADVVEPDASADTSEPDASTDTDDPDTEDPIVTANCVLIPAVGGDVFAPINSGVSLAVYAYSTANGQAMPGVPVAFTVDTERSVTVGLSHDEVTTSASGEARVQVTTTAQAGFATVIAEAACGAPIEIEIDIMAVPVGDLLVNFSYPSRALYDVSPVRAELLLDSTRRCSQLAPGSDPEGELRAGQANNTNGSVAFNALPVSDAYTVVAIGYGRYGERAAWGCMDNVQLIEGDLTTITVDMVLLPLNPVGVYDVIARWDFREALRGAGTAGEVIARIADVFEDPGRGLYNLMLDILEAQFGGFVGSLVGGVLELFGLNNVLANLINDAIGSSPALSNLVTIGRDITQVVSDLEVLQTWTIGRQGSPFQVVGTEVVTGVALYWRLNCGPNSPPSCGRTALNWDPAEYGSLAGSWNGYVVDYNRLIIDTHPIDFNYGQLIRFALEYLLLPAATGRPAPVTLLSAVQQVIGCPALGNAIAGGNNRCLFSDSFIGTLVGCVCDNSATCAQRCSNNACFGVEDTCNSFIASTVGPLINGILGSLNVPSVIVAAGSATLVNTDDDLDVELLTNGRWNGSLNFGGTPAPVSATWSGTRR